MIFEWNSCKFKKLTCFNFKNEFQKKRNFVNIKLCWNIKKFKEHFLKFFFISHTFAIHSSRSLEFYTLLPCVILIETSSFLSQMSGTCKVINDIFVLDWHIKKTRIRSRNRKVKKWIKKEWRTCKVFQCETGLNGNRKGKLTKFLEYQSLTHHLFLLLGVWIPFSENYFSGFCKAWTLLILSYH